MCPLNAADLWTAVRRHRLVAVSGVVSTVLISVFLWFTVPVFHQATAQLILLNPAQLDGGGEPLPTNPLVVGGNRSAQVMASNLVTIAQGALFREELEDDGVTSEVGITGVTGGGVVLELSTVAPDPVVAAEDLRQVQVELERALADRQAESGAPDNQLYVLYEFVPRSEPVRLTDDRRRSVALGAGLGLILTVFGLVLAGAGPRDPRPEELDPEPVAVRTGS